MASLSRLLEPSLGATFWMNLLELRASSWTSPAGSLSRLLEPPLGDTSRTHLLKPPLGSATWSRLFAGDGLPVRCAHREIKNSRVDEASVRPEIKDSTARLIVVAPKTMVTDLSFQTVKTVYRGFERLTFYSQKAKRKFYSNLNKNSGA